MTATDETPAQPDMGHASPSDLASVTRASNAPAVTELIPAAQPDAVPAPDGNAGGAGDEVSAHGWRDCTCELLEVTTAEEAERGEVNLIRGRNRGCPVHAADFGRTWHDAVHRARSEP